MKIALLVAALAAQATAPAQPPAAEAAADPRLAARNMLQEPRPGCTPIVVQVSGEDRRYEGTRLDQQPPAQLLYAVDRRVDGCREAAFVSGRRVPSDR